jgi:hypothetical protein
MSSENPNPPTAATWRNRFVAVNLVRIVGTLIAIVGLAAWQSDWLRPGGWAALGIPATLLGLLISFGGSWWLVSKWRTPKQP